MRTWKRWAVLLTLILGLPAVAASAPASEDQPAGLIARWSFEEPAGESVLHDTLGNAGLEVKSDRPLPRVRGVQGTAIDLHGEHRLAVGDLQREEMSQISFAAWVRPNDLSAFREIFRQECPNRLLFSFQEGGTILSLGLNIGGYVECDATIAPAQVLDGMWHHCAATFDGRFMRVYFDGKEIGALERPGKIALQRGIPAFIGSSSGTGEHFQGALDELCIYQTALSAEQIASINHRGLASLATLTQELEKSIASIYVPAPTFAETLALTHKNVAQRGSSLDPDLTRLIAAKLKAAFPQDYEDFVRLTGMAPASYLADAQAEFPRQQAARLVELMLEYKPLTPSQWKQQSGQQQQHWQEAETIQKKYEALVAQAETARFSPAWIEVMLQAGRKIDFRPSVYEPVAPYIPPATPATRTLSADEARDALQRDWLHQAEDGPTPQRIQQEIQWTRQLAQRIQAAGSGQLDFARELSQLSEFQQRASSISAPDRELYFAVRTLKRQIAMQNPVVDFDKVLFVDMPFPQGSEWQHETRHRLGYMAVPGARLLVLEGLSPSGNLRQLMPQAPLHGSFWRPDLSFDAKKVLFCFKPHNEKSFHLYEINVDGTGFVQLTEGPFDDFDPIYLPDGHLVFSTTRGHTYVRCMPPTNAFVLARCDADGKNVYLISYNNEPDYLPSVMNDGRVIHTRWEYTDKPLWRAQKLWTANPDGTQVATFWGNQSVWPDLLKDARSIPGSRRVMFTGSAHHNWFSGSVGIIDPDQGFNFPEGLTKVTAEVAWPECGNGPVDPVESPRYHTSGRYAAYDSPYPLSEQDFLVSAQRDGKFVLYLMDVDGNRELIYEGLNNIFYAMPLKARPRPPVIADRVAWPTRDQRLNPQDGVLYSGNVYYGAPSQLQHKARYVRVLHIDPKTYTYWYKRPYISTGPVVSAVQSEGVKRILGTVPIEDDGSFAFRAPASKALHFQLLDENHRALQTMRSFTGVMPGERRGCLGCHESHSRTPQQSIHASALAREPRNITPPPWDDHTVSYARYVQPVLDKYCGTCHQGTGEARQVLDLTQRPGFLDFTEPYLTLIGRPTWGAPYVQPENPPPGWGIANMIMVEAYGTVDPIAYRTPSPMTRLSYRSRLIDIAANNDHYGVQVDPISLQRLIAWVDAMCPFLGDDEIRQIPDPVFPGVDWLSIRPKVHSAPRIVRPGPVD